MPDPVLPPDLEITRKLGQALRANHPMRLTPAELQWLVKRGFVQWLTAGGWATPELQASAERLLAAAGNGKTGHR